MQPRPRVAGLDVRHAASFRQNLRFCSETRCVSEYQSSHSLGLDRYAASCGTKSGIFVPDSLRAWLRGPRLRSGRPSSAGPKPAFGGLGPPSSGVSQLKLADGGSQVLRTWLVGDQILRIWPGFRPNPVDLAWFPAKSYGFGPVGAQILRIWAGWGQILRIWAGWGPDPADLVRLDPDLRSGSGAQILRIWAGWDPAS